MSSVYRAFDQTLERWVAIKMMHREFSTQPDQLERFRREARSAAGLSHPHVVTVIDAGEDDGHPYIVLEYVEGETLKHRIRRQGRLPTGEAVAYAIEIGRALETAHAARLVHRDIKPQNVQVIEDGEPRAKLMDFGVAQLAGDTPLTAVGDIVGTLAYMSPEQAEGKPAGPEADVYSLALTLYECWSGENPNRRAGPAATARAIGGRTRSLRRLRPDLPRELTDTIDACLARRPNHRPSLEDLGTAIEDSLDQLPDHLPAHGGHLATRVGALAAAAAVGGFLALNGAALP
jgi:eukaryotic-like serine/threonine-protein kinase